MRNFHFPFSLLSLCSSTVAVLAIVYIGLIATVMSYATLTVEFSQSVKNTEAMVAVLEGQYLSNMAHIQSLNYYTIGYTAPLAKIYVPTESMTAVR